MSTGLQGNGGDAVKDEGFENFLETALQDSPPDIAEQLKTGLTKRYIKPPLDELQLCLGRNLPLQKARQLLFNPDEEGMRLYPSLISTPPTGSPDNHPQRAVQVCALASLYLVHSKRWERVKPFVEAGGLGQLAAALAHSNAYLASQAMSTLLHITDEDMLFPWHDPPGTPDGRGPRHGPYALVWRRMYELSGGPLLPNLLAHYRTPAVFPGASGMALRLFAFYLSWMRRHFTQDGKLSLSSQLLDMLQRWSVDPEVTEEERQLAKQLHSDFSRFPPAKQPQLEGGSVGAAAHHLGGLSGGEDDEYSVTVVSERTVINSGPSQDNEAEVLKEQGNAAYRSGDYTTAIHLYSAALDVLVPAERLLTEAPRRASYHANRAAAYMARASTGRLREGDTDTAGHLESVDHGSEGATARHFEAAVIDCDMALALEPAGSAAAKTLLRKCRALQRLGRRDEAAAAARAGLDKLDGGSRTGGGTRAELLEALRALERGVKQTRQTEETEGKEAAGSRGPGAVGGVAVEGVSKGSGVAAAGGIDWSAMD